MPFYPERKILFIHIPKTAGIYISKILGVGFEGFYRNYRPTLEQSRSLFLRDENNKESRNNPSRSKRLLRTLLRLPLPSGRAHLQAGKSSADYLIGGATFELAMQNLTVGELLRYGLVSQRDLLASRKIVSVRHPEDRFRSLVSYWNFPDIGLDIDWVIQNCLIRPSAQLPVEVKATFAPMSFYISNPLVKADQWEIIRYETLHEDLERLLPGEFSRASCKADDRVNASESAGVVLEGRHLDLLREYYSTDYELFGYRHN